MFIKSIYPQFITILVTILIWRSSRVSDAVRFLYILPWKRHIGIYAHILAIPEHFSVI